MEGLGDESTNVKINEFKICDEVSKGNRNPSAAGARICGEKYMMTTAEDGVTQLSSTKGGGTVARSGKALVIGLFDKESMMSNNLN